MSKMFALGCKKPWISVSVWIERRILVAAEMSTVRRVWLCTKEWRASPVYVSQTRRRLRAEISYQQPLTLKKLKQDIHSPCITERHSNAE